MQQGMLLHSIYDKIGVYIQQIVCELHEPISEELLIAAWQLAIELHAVLRTSFRWEGLPAPVQEVRREVELPFVSEDWSGLTPEIREQKIARYTRDDRQRRFELNQAPLMRVALFKFGERDYRMVWIFHHALLDGRSHFLVLKDVFEAYDTSFAGSMAALKQPRPYSDYIEWLENQDLPKAETFWRQTLRGFRSPTDLRLPTPPSGEQGHATQLRRLSPELTGELRSLAQRNQVTLNNLVQAGWALLLSRYSGEEDVLFGVTRACRHWTDDGAESMVGLYINTLPFRVRRSDQNLLEWLRELRAQHVALREYEHTPLMKIQGWSEAPRGTPLFDSVLVFEDYQMNSRLRALGERWSARDFILLEQTNYPLTLAAYASSDLLLKLEYEQQRFDPSVIERVLNHLETLLVSMAANPNRPVREISMLSETERRQLLVEWNQTTKAGPGGKCIHELFEAQAAAAPDAVALVCEDRQLSYSELSQRANQLAHHLKKRGVGPDVLVGICVERSVEMIIGLLGILKAGGAYLPLDPLYPEERLAFMIRDAGTSTLLIQEAFRDKFASLHGMETICLDANWEKIAAESTENLSSGVNEENLAYVIYTSGSTGQPKGVLVTHRNVVRLFAATDSSFKFNSSDAWTLFHSYTFDFSVWEIWGALLYGGRLIIVPHWTVRQPKEFCRLLREEKVTVLNQTPSAFRQLVQAEGIAESMAVRLIILGGEALDLSSLEPLLDRQEDARPQLVNMYGITETTVHVTYRPLGVADLAESCRSPIGRPLSDLQVYVLDHHADLVPVGIPGELYVGGDGLARGYLNRPDLTAERFIANPFGESGERIYRTGDLGRYLPDGNLEYLGRTDDQVKVRGFRIELGEVESCLACHPVVRKCAVIVREDQPGQRNLAAYVVTATEPPTANELRSFLKRKLPEYMVPSVFVHLDELPLTENGKLDRKALPAPLPASAGNTFVAPRDSPEEIIAVIWSEVLGLKQISVLEDFFELGGDSLTATQVMSRIDLAFQIDLPPGVLFEQRTVAALAAAVEESLIDELSRTSEDDVAGTSGS